jgi:hypothetical protein
MTVPDAPRLKPIPRQLGVDQTTPDTLINMLAKYDIVLAEWE